MGFQMQICSILRKEKEKKKEKKKEKRKVLCSSANELQQNSPYASSGEDYIPQILTVLLEIMPFTFDLCRLLSFVCHF